MKPQGALVGSAHAPYGYKGWDGFSAPSELRPIEDTLDVAEQTRLLEGRLEELELELGSKRKELLRLEREVIESAGTQGEGLLQRQAAWQFASRQALQQQASERAAQLERLKATIARSQRGAASLREQNARRAADLEALGVRELEMIRRQAVAERLATEISNKVDHLERERRSKCSGGHELAARLRNGQQRLQELEEQVCDRRFLAIKLAKELPAARLAVMTSQRRASAAAAHVAVAREQLGGHPLTVAVQLAEECNSLLQRLEDWRAVQAEDLDSSKRHLVEMEESDLAGMQWTLAQFEQDALEELDRF